MNNETEIELTDEEKAMENADRAETEERESQLATATQIAYDLIQRGRPKEVAINDAAIWVSLNAPHLLTSNEAAEEIRTRLQ